MLNMQKILILILLSFNFYEVIPSNVTFTPVIITGEYKKEYEFVVNNTVEYVFLYPTNNMSVLETERIQVESNATHDLPLLVVVRQKREFLSWQIPLVVDSLYFNDLSFNKTSRTLCSAKCYRADAQHDFVTVSLSTASEENIFFKLCTRREYQFYLNTGEKREVKVSPAEPIYYGYTFPPNSSSVIVHVKSDSEICMTVSIQNTSCPVFDLERNIEFSGAWQTVSQQGGITVPKEAYPLGFFVVLVVKGDDTDCYGSPYMNPSRIKQVTIEIIASISKKDYIIASGAVICVMLVFCLTYIVNIFVSKIKERRKINQELLNQDFEHLSTIQSPSTIEETEPNQILSSNSDSSLDEDDIDMLEDAKYDKDVIRSKLILSVCDLARKDPKILRHKSLLYLYYLITVAIFYTLPVVQLVITYQHVLHDTGNQDMCYYNFLCAHPFGLVSDFNHIFSNIGYIVSGLLFVFITYTRELKFDKERNKCYGIPQHYGLFYAMGTALIMEGILSGSYHVCPNRSNFQFDTSFMYIIAVLCMIKIYQTRHPDVNARAPITFGVLAFTIFIGLMGVLNNNTGFWVSFTIAHLLTCLYLTLQIYYMGRSKGRALLRILIQNCKHDAHAGIRHLFRPLYPARFIMLVIANLCNVTFAVFGNMYHEKNFASFLLAILMSNLVLYTIFYIVMKLCHKERIMLESSFYIFLSLVLWSFSLYFFINKTISWAITPAQSRVYNRPCELLNFFDSHDIWHFLSAFAMFFSFMSLLTLDDDLVDVHRSQIPVF